MLTAKIYDAIKSDIEYTQDTVIRYVKAKNLIEEYLQSAEFITNEKVRELCGFTRQQARTTSDKMRFKRVSLSEKRILNAFKEIFTDSSDPTKKS